MIGHRIKALRDHFRLNQADFSSKIGISQSYLSSVERNQKVPGGDVLISLKSLFDFNSDWLLTGEGDMYIVKEGAKRAREDAELGAKAVSTQTEAETNAGAAQTGQKGTTQAPSPSNAQTSTQNDHQSPNNDQDDNQSPQDRSNPGTFQSRQERLSSNQGDHQSGDQPNRPLNASSTQHQQQVNARSTQQQQPFNANAAAQSIKTAPFFYEAIGRRLAVREESIEEGDILVIDPVIPAAEGDLILRSSTEGPEIVKYQPGEKNSKGVVVSLTRQYPAINRQ